MRRFYLSVLLILILNLCHDINGAGVGTPPVYSTDLETSLRTELFTGYEVLQRPSKKVDVFVTFNVLTVNDLDIKDQFMSITAYFELKWEDARLSWSDTSSTTQDFSSVQFLFSTEEYVWRPSLIIDNTIEDFSVIHDKYIPMRVTSSGFVVWNPAGIYTIACSSDITYYPLDIQSCTLSLSSWAYTSDEIDLKLSTPAIDFSFYSDNGEWEMVTFSASTGDAKTRGDHTFANVKFTLTMRRRPLFHVLNTLFPVALMSVLSAMVFKLPADSGEKMGFSLTVLLAYAVYLTLISDTIPSTSVTACYLSIYLALILMFGTFAVMCSILVLNVYFRAEEMEISKGWRLATKVMAFLVRWQQPCLPYRCHIRQNDRGNKVESLSLQKAPLPDDKNSIVDQQEVVIENEVNDDLEISWKIISYILDKFFFVCFLGSIGISTFVFLGLIFSEFNSV
ncbi:acetylcholine receptor subunit beta-like [Mizuhopecten yessoensis]|uniref:Neuronal acetylcholine receptor subunit alpha-6 n=1 Tax=Mizuhopecten yessoensis TaxID=6573 RepID=A0A210Q820_MIZYE|nr:acetylcholine receptor subunit beta-like [Mizuhopecten yessoensis]OWF44873.1 Neuronal acetylcholine receptor subunit alpha-6 [Mizuhopecten yessoensis]